LSWLGFLFIVPTVVRALLPMILAVVGLVTGTGRELVRMSEGTSVGAVLEPATARVRPIWADTYRKLLPLPGRGAGREPRTSGRDQPSPR
jgi:hypothetical protein